MPDVQTHKLETVHVNTLHPHPQNYREHPEDQIVHLIESLNKFGFYRNIVTAKDGTILAGHGIYLAAKKAGYTDVPIVRLDLTPIEPAALKVLVGDNEMGNLIEQNDRMLADLLKEISTTDESGLLGTGYEQMSFANFVMVTRPESEIQSIDEAAHWVGVPDYVAEQTRMVLMIQFKTDEDRVECARRLGIALKPKEKSYWFPPVELRDRRAEKFTTDEIIPETESEEVVL